jgi:hypothetical protein
VQYEGASLPHVSRGSPCSTPYYIGSIGSRRATDLHHGFRDLLAGGWKDHDHETDRCNAILDEHHETPMSTETSRPENGFQPEAANAISVAATHCPLSEDR